MGVMSREQLGLHENVIQTEGHIEDNNPLKLRREANHTRAKGSVDMSNELPIEEEKEERVVTAHT